VEQAPDPRTPGVPGLPGGPLPRQYQTAAHQSRTGGLTDHCPTVRRQ
jgi:hypothetical protein